MKHLSTIGFLIIAMIPVHGTAQVWKEVGPDGKVTYSNSPSGMKKPAKVEMPPSTQGVYGAGQPHDPAGAPPSPPPAGNPSASPSEPQANQRIMMLERLEEARTALAKARSDMEKGAEPMEGERQRTVSGSRLSEAYVSRQESLKKKVDDMERQIRDIEAALLRL